MANNKLLITNMCVHWLKYARLEDMPGTTLEVVMHASRRQRGLQCDF